MAEDPQTNILKGLLGQFYIVKGQINSDVFEKLKPPPCVNLRLILDIFEYENILMVEDPPD